MPINLFGYSSFSQEKGNKTDTALCVPKPLRTIYIESNIEEEIDKEN